MSTVRATCASSKASAASSAETHGCAFIAHLKRSMVTCTQPGCSLSTRAASVGASLFNGRAPGVKKRKAS